MAINHLVIEGVDRLGKDTLIQGIQDRLGFFQVLHYQKPKLLAKYSQEAYRSLKEGQDVKSQALKTYQFYSFITMFKMMRGNTRILCNRAHLGETVYAKRYRGYDGNYVFNIERLFSYSDGPLEHVLLVMLYTSDFSFITDDGLSLDVTKREEEQADFLEAFNRSTIPNKILIDVCNGHGGFLPAESILEKVLAKLGK